MGPTMTRRRQPEAATHHLFNYGGKKTAWVAGAASGFFGGIAGEQGGFRAIGLLGFDLKKDVSVQVRSFEPVIISAVARTVPFCRFH